MGLMVHVYMEGGIVAILVPLGVPTQAQSTRRSLRKGQLLTYKNSQLSDLFSLLVTFRRRRNRANDRLLTPRLQIRRHPIAFGLRYSGNESHSTYTYNFPAFGLLSLPVTSLAVVNEQCPISDRSRSPTARLRIRHPTALGKYGFRCPERGDDRRR